MRLILPDNLRIILHGPSHRPAIFNPQVLLVLELHLNALLLLVEILNFYFLAGEVKVENLLFILFEVFFAQERINEPLLWHVWRLIHLF